MADQIGDETTVTPSEAGDEAQLSVDSPQVGQSDAEIAADLDLDDVLKRSAEVLGATEGDEPTGTDPDSEASVDSSGSSEFNDFHAGNEVSSANDSSQSVASAVGDSDEEFPSDVPGVMQNEEKIEPGEHEVSQSSSNDSPKSGSKAKKSLDKAETGEKQELLESSSAEGVKSKLVGLVSSFRGSKQGLSQIGLVFTGVFSSDPPTRKMSLLFLVSLLGILSICGTLWMRNHRENQQLAANLAQVAEQERAEYAKKMQEESHLRGSMAALGKFILQLNPIEGKRAPGVLYLAEVEIMLLCDSVETASYIERNQDAAKSELISVLTPMDRDELLSHDGKNRWKSILIRRLNGWLTRGEVVDLYFSQLIIN